MPIKTHVLTTLLFITGTATTLLTLQLTTQLIILNEQVRHHLLNSLIGKSFGRNDMFSH